MPRDHPRSDTMSKLLTSKPKEFQGCVKRQGPPCVLRPGNTRMFEIVFLFSQTQAERRSHPLRPLNQDTSALKSCPQPPPHSPSIRTDIPLPALDLMLFKHTEF